MASAAVVSGIKRAFSDISDGKESGEERRYMHADATQHGDREGDSMGDSANRRRSRKAPNRYTGEEDEADMALRIALERSKRLAGRSMKDMTVPDAPSFYPTQEEFEDPAAYIEKIRPLAEPFGICKVVPPRGWQLPCTEATRMRSSVKYKTRLQALHTLQEGLPFPDGKFYTYAEYKAMADEFKYGRHPHLVPLKTETTTAENTHHSGVMLSPAAMIAPTVEQAYWEIVEHGKPQISVEYGNDQDGRDVGSGFPAPHKSLYHGDSAFPSPRAAVKPDFSDDDYYAKTSWNLNILPFAPRSVLRHLDEEINGVNVPWVYLGMLFSTFAWHNEDHFMYSINYMHNGEGKTWYGLPGFAAGAFEKALKTIIYERAKQDADIVYHLTTVISPAQLKAEGVPVFRLFQEPGDFIITFPQAYHAGFSHGFNMAEACNFALTDWLPFGRHAIEKYRVASSTRSMCFSHDQLLCNLAHHHLEYSPENCAIIAAELKAVAEQERRERDALVKDGVTMGVALPNVSDPRYECVRCRQICYLSSVVCRCVGATKQVSCLRHHRYLCNCPAASKLLVYWYKLDQLDALATSVAADATRDSNGDDTNKHAS